MWHIANSTYSERKSARLPVGATSRAFGVFVTNAAIVSPGIILLVVTLCLRLCQAQLSGRPQHLQDMLKQTSAQEERKQHRKILETKLCLSTSMRIESCSSPRKRKHKEELTSNIFCSRRVLPSETPHALCGGAPRQVSPCSVAARDLPMESGLHGLERFEHGLVRSRLVHARP